MLPTQDSLQSIFFSHRIQCFVPCTLYMKTKVKTWEPQTTRLFKVHVWWSNHFPSKDFCLGYQLRQTCVIFMDPTRKRFFIDLRQEKEKVGWSCSVSSLKLTAKTPENGWVEYYCPFFLASFQVRTVSVKEGSLVKQTLWFWRVLPTPGQWRLYPHGFVKTALPLGPRWCSVKIWTPQSLKRLRNLRHLQFRRVTWGWWFSLVAREFLSKSAAKQIQVEIAHVTSILYTFA